MKVAIVGPDWEIGRMFLKRGHKLTHFDEADLIQFTGGSDVDPSYYKEERHASTYADPRRDSRESNIYHTGVAEGKKFAGICRGGQFLNVMNGGKMWQDVNNHGGSHKALFGDKEIVVTSTHHQMMRPTPEAIILGTAKRSSYRETVNEVNTDKDFVDIEALAYPNCICFQPHPEYSSATEECEQMYFDLLEAYLGLS